MNVLQNLAQATSLQMVNCLVLGIGIAALAGAASSLIGRKSAGVRFLIWSAALVATASFFVWIRPAGQDVVRSSLPQVSLPPQWALFIFGAWAFFAAVGLARVVRGLVRVRELKKTCVTLEASHACGIQSSLGSISRRVELRTSSQVRVPAALGFFRPMIALPDWTVRELSDQELETVVLHEAAHLQRWDDWTNLLQKIIRAVLFFHPAVWWIDSRLSIEREMSCDDIVLVKSQSARQYAACLVSLAEKTHAHRSLALVQAAVSHVRHTAARISKILDGKQRTAKPLFGPAVGTVLVFSVVSFVAVRHTPQLVSFSTTIQNSAQHAAVGKLDYVANADEPRAKAITASVHPPIARTAVAPQTHFAEVRKPISPRPKHNLSPAPMTPQAEEARNQPEGHTPAVVNAAMRTDATAHFVYIVTQTEQYDGFGNVTITTSVWRIRVKKPAPAQVQGLVLPHQT